MAEKTLENRAHVLLKALVERYIRDGQPVGSKTLAEDSGLSLSSATVRNVLAELEEQGYLQSPHTSAGRIPTSRGYRLFVDSLLTVHPFSEKEVQKVRRELDPALETKDLLSVASSLISKITSLTGLVTLPKPHQMQLTHVEFLLLSENRLLVVLVLNGKEIQNRIIRTNRKYSSQELQEASNYLNHHFMGTEFNQLKRHLKNKMQEDKREINELLQSAIDMPTKTGEPFVVSGQTRELFEAFTQKSDILHLLDQCLHTDVVQIYIGEESGCRLLDGLSLITSPYSVDNQTVGVLAVIGPTRMAYDRVIPIVDITARLLSSALRHDA